MKRAYGWKHDRPDHRDFLYCAPRRILGLPAKTDLRAGCSPVEDQGQLGSCTGNSSVGALEFLEIKIGSGFSDLSRLMAYYNGRAIEGTVKQDAGAEIRDVIKGLADTGTSTEKTWPYDIRKFSRKPSKSAFTEAAQRKITSYQRLMGLQDVRACLAEGYPVVFGFEVPESFEGDEVARTGILKMPAKNERFVGGHAVLAVGYDDDAKRVLVRNSWGSGWGLAGYFWMDYGYFQNARLTSDFWTIRK